MNPLITIITSTYNASKTLQRCIDSVAAQSFGDVEHIIIDGASTDGTASIIQGNVEKQGTRISYWLSEPDKGIYDAWNKAIPHVKGEWVMFLGADDWLYDDEALERMASHLKSAYPKNIVVYGKICYRDKDGAELQCGMKWNEMKPFASKQMPFPHQSTFHHKSLFANYGVFDMSYKIAGDFEFITRIFTDKSNLDRVVFVDSLVALMSYGGISSTRQFTIIKEYNKIRKLRGADSFVVNPYIACLKCYLSLNIKSIFGERIHQKVLAAWRILRRSFFV